MIIKVCGMTEGKNIRQVETAGAEWMGFVFYPPSPRYARHIPDYLPERARRVGVFVDASTESIMETVRQWGLHLVQLHGQEMPAQCLEIRKKGTKVIKAFSVRNRETLETLSEYGETCDFFLFDTPCESHGGSGRRFDWTLLNAYQGHTPFLLGGGLNPESVGPLTRLSHPQWAGIDLNSGFELSPGIKDAEAVAGFIRDLRTAAGQSHEISPNLPDLSLSPISDSRKVKL